MSSDINLSSIGAFVTMQSATDMSAILAKALRLNLEKSATVEEINSAMHAAQSNTFGYNDLPLVSIDFTHDAHSSVFDAGQTKVLGDKLVHVTAWYDNEWGFSNRMCDTAVAMGKLI